MPALSLSMINREAARLIAHNWAYSANDTEDPAEPVWCEYPMPLTNESLLQNIDIFSQTELKPAVMKLLRIVYGEAPIPLCAGIFANKLPYTDGFRQETYGGVTLYVKMVYDSGSDTEMLILACWALPYPREAGVWYHSGNSDIGRTLSPGNKLYNIAKQVRNLQAAMDMLILDDEEVR